MRSPRTQTKAAAAKADEQFEREKQALHLRKAGASYRAIGDQLGISHEQARRDIEQALAYIRDDVGVDAKALRDLEVARLDDWLVRLEGKLRTGDDKAINTGLRIMERRSKLLGLDAPVKVQELTWKDKAYADIREGVVTFEQVAKMFDNDESYAAQLFREAGVTVQR